MASRTAASCRPARRPCSCWPAIPSPGACAITRCSVPSNPFFTRDVLRLEPRSAEEPRLSAALVVSPEYTERLATGRPYRPPFGAEFPAQRLTTAFEWEDLVLDRPTREEIEDILTWARHEELLMRDWGLARQLRRGYRALFYGAPGTGKTLTAGLLGKVTGRDVYRVDLSKVVSKWIGETEKNLASLFDHAQRQDWILFFDEADSLFGKRTESRTSNDRAANQQIAYLLQRIEDFRSIVILATNLRSHLDEAFARRFQSMVYFALPSAEQRLRLWDASCGEAVRPGTRRRPPPDRPRPRDLGRRHHQRASLCVPEGGRAQAAGSARRGHPAGDPARAPQGREVSGEGCLTTPHSARRRGDGCGSGIPLRE